MPTGPARLFDALAASGAKPLVLVQAAIMSAREMRHEVRHLLRALRAPPVEPRDRAHVYNNCLEQVRLADELGFDQVWAVEHHFLEEYSHCSAPELFLTACAMQTKNIRVGHGIVVCVPQFNHPIRIAERAAVLDILSGGRLEFGTGRSATWTELGGFRADPDTTKKTWDEFVRCLPEDVDEGALRLRGRVLLDAGAHRAARSRTRSPHPPHVGRGDQPRHRARRRRPRHGQPRPHLRRLQGAGEADRRSTAGASSTASRSAPSSTTRSHRQLPLLPRGRRRRRRDRPAHGRHVQLPRRASSSRPARPIRRAPTRPSACCRSSRRQATGRTPTSRSARASRSATRSASFAPSRSWESTGVDRINFLLNANETIPQAEVLASLKLFAKEVMPVFQKGAAAQPTAKVA